MQTKRTKGMNSLTILCLETNSKNVVLVVDAFKNKVLVDCGTTEHLVDSCVVF